MPTDDILTRTVRIGRYKGQTWGMVLRWDASYVEWAIREMRTLTDHEREALQMAYEDVDPGDRDDADDDYKGLVNEY